MFPAKIYLQIESDHVMPRRVKLPNFSRGCEVPSQKDEMKLPCTQLLTSLRCSILAGAPATKLGTAWILNLSVTQGD